MDNDREDKQIWGDKEKLLKEKIAYLESVNDQLYSELLHIDQMMRAIGFSNGLSTVKETAKGISEEGGWEEQEEDEEVA